MFNLCTSCSPLNSWSVGLLANCFLAFWPTFVMKQNVSSNYQSNKSLNLRIFPFFSIFGTSPAWQSSKLTFAWNAVGRSSFGEVDHGRRQKPLPAMRACEQKQNPMLWFVWRVRQLQRWAALFLSMAGRSCLLRYSWFGENSNVFERRVVCFSLKRKCPHQTERGWLVGARGTEWSRLHSPHTLPQKRSFVSIWKTAFRNFAIHISHLALSIQHLPFSRTNRWNHRIRKIAARKPLPQKNPTGMFCLLPSP